MDNPSKLPATRVSWFPMTRILPRNSKDSCHPQPDVDLCEKPGISSNTAVIAVIIVAAILVSSLLAVLVFLHLRRRRMEKTEQLKDLQELDDYGLAPIPTQPSKTAHLPQAPPPAQMDIPSSRNHEPAPAYSVADHRSRDRRTSEESLALSLRQAAPAVPRDGLASN